MNKKLNATAITNELAEGSAFFPSKPKEIIVSHETTPPSSSVVTVKHNKGQMKKDSPVPPVRDMPLVPVVREVPPVPPIKRTMKQRHPFDIYQDQYESLQKLALEERMQG